MPAAVIFDLGRGGEFANTPDAELGREAWAPPTSRWATEPSVQAPAPASVASRAESARPRPGSRTAPPSARWWWSTRSARRSTSAPGSCTPHATAGRATCPTCGRPTRPSCRPRATERPVSPSPTPPLATTLAVIATDATLTKAQCLKVSGIGHDGFARAINPVHTMFDGDTVFTLATGSRRRTRCLRLPCASWTRGHLAHPRRRPRDSGRRVHPRVTRLPGRLPLRLRLRYLRGAILTRAHRAPRQTVAASAASRLLGWTLPTMEVVSASGGVGASSDGLRPPAGPGGGAAR